MLMKKCKALAGRWLEETDIYVPLLILMLVAAGALASFGAYQHSLVFAGPAAIWILVDLS